jgi:hypothetical protein
MGLHETIEDVLQFIVWRFATIILCSLTHTHTHSLSLSLILSLQRMRIFLNVFLTNWCWCTTTLKWHVSQVSE